VKTDQVKKLADLLGWQYDDHFNHSPFMDRVVVEITEHEFIRSHAFDGVGHDYEYRQVWPNYLQRLDPKELSYYNRPVKKSVETIKLFVVHGCVYGVSTGWWEGKMRYWRCGCKHQYETVTIRMFHHVDTCKICGYSVGRDSSD
jgi:hypothetical protein